MKNRALRSTLAAFRGKRILIVGDVILDEYIWGEVQRLSPEAPVPIVEVRQRTYRPGGAANAAVNVHSLGGQVLLGGVVGQDSSAMHLRHALMECEVAGESLVRDGARPTTTKTRIIAHGQQIVRVDHEERASLPAMLEDTLLQWVEKHLPDVHACILSDYAKGVVSSRLAKEFIGLARRAGKPVVVDPKGTDYLKYRGATLVTPNIHEVEQAIDDHIKGDDEVARAGRRLVELLEGSAVLITRGEEGMSLFNGGNSPLHIPTEARHVFDVTGAGDTVVSTLAMSLATGSPLEGAARLANAAAGIVVGKMGTSGVTIDEMLPLLDDAA